MRSRSSASSESSADWMISSNTPTSVVGAYRLTANVTETTAVTSFARELVSLMPSLLTSVELRGVIWYTPRLTLRTAPRLPPRPCAIVLARSSASAVASRSAANFAVFSFVDKYSIELTETSTPCSRSRSTEAAAWTSVSIFVVCTSNDCVTSKAGTERKRGFLRPVGTCTDVAWMSTGGFDTASVSPASPRYAETAAAFARSERAAAAGVRSIEFTVTFQNAWSAVIGYFAEPVTTIVSRVRLMSRTPLMTIEAVSGIATASASATATSPISSCGSSRPRGGGGALISCAGCADGPQRAPRATVVLPQKPRAVELLGLARAERIRRVTGMRERGVGHAAHALPGLRHELHAAEVAVARVRRPRPLLHVHAMRLHEPARRGQSRG